MMGTKQKLKTALEVDVLYGRRLYCYLKNNHKVIKYAKKQMSRRRRHDAKESVKKYLEVSK